MENALARAEELIAVNQQSAALQLLYDAIISRHFQHNLLALEPIMHRFVELCVELRQGRFVKDGLSQYRLFSQTTNMQSFEVIVRKFVGLTEARLEEAMKAADSISTTSALDSSIESDPAVEEVAKMLQSQLSFESGKSNFDRQTVLPWMRFAWEALRAGLEVCRNNQKLEKLYAELAFKSFDYCIKYQRKSELKRLAETLRYHLMGIVKSAGSTQPMIIALTGESASPDSQQLQLDIRYRQLDVALEMELWQEAFRSIEDIHGLFLLEGKTAEALMSREEYFEKVARIFAMSDNVLFYAAALIRRLNAFTEAQNDAIKESVKRAIAVSLLSVPLGPNNVTDSVFNNGSWAFLEDQHSRATRLAYFLGLDAPPTLHSLLAEVQQMTVSDSKLEEIVNIYSSLDYQKCSIDYLEDTFEHLKTIPEVSRLIPSIIQNFVYLHIKYLEGKQVSVSIPQCEAYLLSAFGQSVDLLQLLVKWVRSSDLSVSIDQSSMTFAFTNKTLLTEESSPVFLDFEDPKVVYMHQLCLMLQDKSESAFAGCKALFEKLEAAKRESIKRHEAAERAREERELHRREREKEEAKERAQRLQAEQEAEERRLADEAARRERDRLNKEREQIRKAEQKKKEEEERRLAELSGMRANMERLQLLAVRLDHIERAIRVEELPLLEADYKKQLEEDSQLYERHAASIKEQSRQAYENDCRLLNNITPVKSSIDGFIEKIRAFRQSVCNTKQQDLDEQFKVAKAARIAKLTREREIAMERLKEAPRKADLASAIEDVVSSSSSGAPTKYMAPSLRAIPATSTPTDPTNAWRRETNPSVQPIPKPVVQAAVVPPAKDSVTTSAAPTPGKYVPPHLKNIKQ
jgi:translation initiation factor 3 subunit A